MFLSLLLAALLAPEPPQFQVNTLDGQTAVGKFVELTDRQLTVATADGNRTFPLAQVRFLGPPDKPAADSSAAAPPAAEKPTVWIETLDGSRISGAGFESTKGTARLKLDDGQTVAFPVKAILRVEFPGADGAAPTWVASAKTDAAADLIAVRKKDGIDFVEGSIGDVGDEKVNFLVDGDNVPVKRAKVAGLVYFHPPEDAEPLEPSCVVVADAAGVRSDAGSVGHVTTGWRLNAKSATLVDGKLQIVTNFGPTVSRPLESLRSIDFSPSRLGYLSDLPLDSVQWTPFVDFGKQADSLAQFYQPRRDRGLEGGPLSLGGKTYPKGLAIPSRTSLVYKIAHKGKRLKATVGIDDSVRSLGDVKLVVKGDGKTLFEQRITGRDAPLDLDLDVAGVTKLNILVDFGEGLDVGNYLDLCDARIVK